MNNNRVFKILVVLTLLGHSVVGKGQLLTSEELKAGNYQLIDIQVTIVDTTDMELLSSNTGVLPMYPGGIEGVFRDFTANIIYPMKARRKGLEGHFAIQYVIETDGKISFFKVIEPNGPVDEILVEAAKQAISGMKRWHPGFLHDKPVRFLYTQPVNFKLSK